MTFNELTNKCDNLVIQCEQLHSLCWLFGENYTSNRDDRNVDAVKQEPGVFASSYSLIEDLIENLRKTVDEVTTLAYQAARESHKNE